MESKSSSSQEDVPAQPLPRMSVMAILSLIFAVLGLACLPFGIVGLVLGIIALTKVNGSQGRLTGRGLAIAGLVVGALSILMMPIMAGLTLPVLARAREQARRSSSANNLGNMIKCCHLYSDASTNRGMFPDDPIKLYPKYVKDFRVFQNPRFSDQDVGYMYVPGSGPMDATNVVFFENVTSRRAADGRNVAFAAGNVEWVEERDFQAMVARMQQAGAPNPVPISLMAVKARSGP